MKKDEALSLLRDEEIHVVVEKRRIKIRRHVLHILTCLDGKYQLWKDERDPHDPKRWRWSLRDWPDDNIGGIPHHGAARDLDSAVRACLEHHECWQSVKNIE